MARDIAGSTSLRRTPPGPLISQWPRQTATRKPCKRPSTTFPSTRWATCASRAGCSSGSARTSPCRRSRSPSTPSRSSSRWPPPLTASSSRLLLQTHPVANTGIGVLDFIGNGGVALVASAFAPAPPLCADRRLETSVQRKHPLNSNAGHF
ncbi:hypothetical protein BKA93DRAFT_625060 [Sparassis latifolia]